MEKKQVHSLKEESDNDYDNISKTKNKRLKYESDSSSGFEDGENEMSDSEGEWIIKTENEAEVPDRVHEDIKEEKEEEEEEEDSYHQVDEETQKKIKNQLNKIKAKMLKTKTKDNAAGIEQTVALLREYKELESLITPPSPSKTKSKIQKTGNNEPAIDDDHYINAAASAKPNQSSSSSTELKELVRQEKLESKSPLLMSMSRLRELQNDLKANVIASDLDEQFDNYGVDGSNNSGNNNNNNNQQPSKKELKQSDKLEAKIQQKIDAYRNRVQHIVNDTCPLCPESKAHKRHVQGNNKVVSSSEHVYMAVLPSSVALEKDCSILVPRRHVPSLLHCNDEEWQELRDYMKEHIRFWVDMRGYKGVLFYENAAYSNQSWMHANMNVVPVRWVREWAGARGIFRNYFETAGGEEDWKSVHRKLIITSEDEGNSDYKPLRNSIAKEAPYFHVWFYERNDQKKDEGKGKRKRKGKEKDEGGGYGHIIDEEELKRGEWKVEKSSGGLDITGREIIAAGILEEEDELNFSLPKRPRWDYYNKDGEKEARNAKWTYQGPWDRRNKEIPSDYD